MLVPYAYSVASVADERLAEDGNPGKASAPDSTASDKSAEKCMLSDCVKGMSEEI